MTSMAGACLALLALAGCLAPGNTSGAAGASTPEPPAADAPPRLYDKPMAMGRGVTVAGPGPFAQQVPRLWIEQSVSSALDVPVRYGDTAILLEMVVEAGEGRLLAHLAPPGWQSPLPPPDDSHYAPQESDGTATLLVEDPAVGDWLADAHADGTAQGMAYHLYATVFSGPVPEGYTAVPQ